VIKVHWGFISVGLKVFKEKNKQTAISTIFNITDILRSLFLLLGEEDLLQWLTAWCWASACRTWPGRDMEMGSGRVRKWAVLAWRAYGVEIAPGLRSSMGLGAALRVGAALGWEQLRGWEYLWGWEQLWCWPRNSTVLALSTGHTSTLSFIKAPLQVQHRVCCTTEHTPPIPPVAIWIIQHLGKIKG